MSILVKKYFVDMVLEISFAFYILWSHYVTIISRRCQRFELIPCLIKNDSMSLTNRRPSNDKTLLEDILIANWQQHQHSKWNDDISHLKPNFCYNRHTFQMFIWNSRSTILNGWRRLISLVKISNRWVDLISLLRSSCDLKQRQKLFCLGLLCRIKSN